jgi:catechol 2,3-dioxygenase-like lactoylglutathione lyase family enzyme
LTNTTPRFTPNFIQVTPFMIVDDLEKALAFFVDLLDFEVQLRVSDYAYVQRETAGFRIWEQKGKDAAPPGTRRFAYYIDVQDVDRLYAELKPKLDKLPPEDVHGPADKPYGQRELLLLAPDGNLLAFGHAIDKRYTPTGDSRM